MAAKMLSRSAEILNDADDFTRQLDWQIFVSEMEAQAATYGGDWYPGKPMHRRPMPVLNPDDQYIRPMIETYDVDYYRCTPMSQLVGLASDCEDCEVLWNTYDPCWVCGKEVPQPKPSSANPYNRLFAQPNYTVPRRTLSQQFIGNVVDVETNDEGIIIYATMSDGFVRTVQQFREGMEMIQYAAYDAAMTMQMFREIWEQRNQEWINAVVDTPRSYQQRFWLDEWESVQISVRDPEPVINCGERFGDNYYDPNGEFIFGNIELPEDLNLSGEIPITPPVIPELPNPVPQRLRYHEENYITNERRRRNI